MLSLKAICQGKDKHKMFVFQQSQFYNHEIYTYKTLYILKAISIGG